MSLQISWLTLKASSISASGQLAVFSAYRFIIRMNSLYSTVPFPKKSRRKKIKRMTNKFSYFWYTSDCGNVIQLLLPRAQGEKGVESEEREREHSICHAIWQEAILSWLLSAGELPYVSLRVNALSKIEPFWVNWESFNLIRYGWSYQWNIEEQRARKYVAAILWYFA